MFQRQHQNHQMYISIRPDHLSLTWQSRTLPVTLFGHMLIFMLNFSPPSPATPYWPPLPRLFTFWGRRSILRHVVFRWGPSHSVSAVLGTSIRTSSVRRAVLQFKVRFPERQTTNGEDARQSRLLETQAQIKHQGSNSAESSRAILLLASIISGFCTKGTQREKSTGRPRGAPTACGQPSECSPTSRLLEAQAKILLAPSTCIHRTPSQSSCSFLPPLLTACDQLIHVRQLKKSAREKTKCAPSEPEAAFCK